jgi:hypothetical protein
MDVRSTLRSVACVSIAIAILALIVALVPAPAQIAVAFIALPIEAMLLSEATTGRRRHTLAS